MIEAIKVRMDSWVNALTGLGSALRDKLTATRFHASARLPDEVLDNLYHEEDMAARICELVVRDALRRGYYLSAEDDTELASKAAEYEKRLRFRPALKQAAIWSRVFGGAVIYLGIDDGQAEDQPVNLEAIKSIKFATVLDKRDLQPAAWYDNPQNDDQYGTPELYEIMSLPITATDTLSVGVRVHESRLLRFDGALTSLRRRMMNRGWCDSVLQKVHDVLVQFNVGWQATAHLLQEAGQGVFKIEGLIDMIASGEKETLQTRFQLIEESRSVCRAIVLDAERESYERQTYAFAGVPEILRSFMLRLAAAADMPVTVLMGQSPSGLNATGESDTRMWYDSVQEYQQETFLPAISRFYELLFAAADFEGEAPEAWEVKFESLWQLTAKEQAELEKLVADKDKVYIDAGVVLAEEVSVNRFKARGFCTDTQIDLDARREMLEAELEAAKEKAGEDPLEALNGAANSGNPPGTPGNQPPGGPAGGEAQGAPAAPADGGAPRVPGAPNRNAQGPRRAPPR